MFVNVYICMCMLGYLYVGIKFVYLFVCGYCVCVFIYVFVCIYLCVYFVIVECVHSCVCYVHMCELGLPVTLMLQIRKLRLRISAHL